MPIIKKFQTTVDFVTQHTGAVDGLFEMALLNGISITGEPAPGTELRVQPAINPAVIKIFGGIKDITSYLPVVFVRPGGIGYMQIGNDFKTS